MKLAVTSAALLALVLALPASAQSTNGQTKTGETTIEKTPSSGPGVKGPPDTRTGPATRAPGQSSGSGGQGTASGSSGASGHDPSQPMTSGGSAGVTQPSQDAKGVQGAPGNKNGPAVKAPGQGGSGSAR